MFRQIMLSGIFGGEGLFMVLQKDSAEHDSHNIYYRCPLGAVEAGTKVKLSLLLLMPDVRTKVLARIWQERTGEKLVEMTRNKAGKAGEKICFSATLDMPEQGCLIWYYFIISCPGENTFYCGNNQQRLGGQGAVSDTVPPSFQITVYNKGAKTPDWFKHAVMYQIFPDRFSRQGDKLIEKKGAVVHASWQDTPCYYKDVDTKEIVAYDFFGGNLAGIREKLTYLKDLGISVIYLNPVFESASNHRYDTGDYHKIDPMLGSNEEFQALCAQADSLGIKLIIDGVFSHTGSDSRYFNREGTYDTVGAFQSQDSPYYSWYSFHKYPYEYDSWWGFSTLPNVKENTPSYLDFIIRDKDSVLHHWLEAGVSGWRLDVVDELPAEFTQTFYREMKRANPEAVLIGEVWEDASNKISYGVPREYLCGQEIDAAMNYPFRKIVLDFLLYNDSTENIGRRILSLWENYPKENFYAMMNLLGSHDVARVLTILGEAPFYEGMPAVHQAHFQLDEAHRILGLQRVRLGMIWQMTFPGVPSIYYGDEIAMQGFKDPYNRGAYKWQGGDNEMRSWCRKLVLLRNGHTALQTGDFLPLCSSGDIFAYVRIVRSGYDVFGKPAANEAFLVVLNRSRNDKILVQLDVSDISAGVWQEALGQAADIEVRRGCLDLELPPLTGYIYKEKKQEHQYPHEAGVLLHPTSLPSKYGIGDFGQAAYDFLDFLQAAGQSIWQILPLNPVNDSYSPYQSPSAFAGNPLLISLEMLVSDGLLTNQELKLPFADHGRQVDYARVISCKTKCLRRAWQVFSKRGATESYQAFCQQEKAWLEDYALFSALQRELGGKAWQDWPQPLRRRDPEALAQYRKRLSQSISFVQFLQYVFWQQWQKLHAYAAQKGVRILGDMPLFVSADSADAWAHQELFRLDGEGHPLEVAGVPPDYFSTQGQLWGNPQYDWQTMRSDGYQWWIERFSKLFSLVDMVRIDHFRGLESYWSVDGEARTAKEGHWVKGPGAEFLSAVRAALGDKPIVAEDLGVLTDEVEALRDEFAYPGMKVLQFELHCNAAGRMGMAAPENSVVYTGTHDNNTTVGWFQNDLDDASASAIASLIGAKSTDAAEVCRKMIEFAYSLSARCVIIPMADVLALDSSNRMNIPGTARGNWRWRLPANADMQGAAAFLRELCQKYQRQGRD